MNPMDASSAKPDDAASPASPGQMLRAAREAKGLHLAVLSVTLKVPTRLLEALENDQYDAFKGLTFLRALAQSVCRHLGIDPAPVLAGLPKSDAPLSIQPVSIDTHRVPTVRPRASFRGKKPSRQVLVLSLLMSAGAAALIWWPLPPTPEAVGEEKVVLPLVLPMPERAASETTAAPLAVEVVAASASASAPLMVQPAASAARSSAIPSASPMPQPALSASGLVISPSAPSWVEVRDSQGQMLVKRMVKGGETLELSPSPPLFVYIGRADTTTLNWRGQPIDLVPHTQNNEARLQIKP